MSKEQKADKSRRGFLKLAGTAAPAALAVIATSGTEAEAAVDDGQQGSGLRDTAHTRAYFDSARF